MFDSHAICRTKAPPHNLGYLEQKHGTTVFRTEQRTGVLRDLRLGKLSLSRPISNAQYLILEENDWILVRAYGHGTAKACSTPDRIAILHVYPLFEPGSSRAGSIREQCTTKLVCTRLDNAGSSNQDQDVQNRPAVSEPHYPDLGIISTGYGLEAHMQGSSTPDSPLVSSTNHRLDEGARKAASQEGVHSTGNWKAA